MTQHTEKFLRHRRFVMVLPILVTPFLALLFWALGGGQGTSATAAAEKPGLNLEFPGAHFGRNEASLWDKFSLYEQAKKDSARYEEARRADPYYEIKQIVSRDSIPTGKGKLMTSLDKKDHVKEMQEQEAIINKKLDELTRFVDSPAVTVSSKAADAEQKSAPEDVQEPDAESVARLEKMMAIMTSSNVEDTEMKQIDQMLDKIIQIQHPEKVKEARNKATSTDQVAVPLKPVKEEDQIRLLGESGPVQASVDGESANTVGEMAAFGYSTNRFFGIDDETGARDAVENAFPAAVHETQTVVSGSTLKMRLVTDVVVGGRLVPKNSFVYGTCAVQGERLLVRINSISLGNSIVPTSLSVYDMDGIEGVYIPGAITRDAAKVAAGQSVQDVDLFSMDSSLGAQAAAAGVEGAKGLFSKKARLIKVTVKAGYNILLRDAKGSGV